MIKEKNKMESFKSNKSSENKIRLFLNIEDSCCYCTIICTGKISDVFCSDFDNFFTRANNKKDFFINYFEDITSIPKSILIIPFLSNIIQIAWIYNADIYVDEIDKNFYDCIDYIKRGYIYKHPNIELNCNIISNKIIENHYETNDSYICFYSGGVDANYTFFNHIEKKLNSLILWGSDLFFKDKEEFERRYLKLKELSSQYNCNAYKIMTSFRSFFNYELVDKFAKGYNTNWWFGFQHSIGIIGHAAPLCYKYKIKNILFSSSYSIYDNQNIPCCSWPVIDSFFKFANTTTIHYDFYISRLEKINFLCNFSKKTNKEIIFHCCWVQTGKENCCDCEKCIRTILMILSCGFDPNDFGFHITPEHLSQKITENKINFNNELYFDIKKSFKKNFTWGHAISQILKKI